MLVGAVNTTLILISSYSPDDSCIWTSNYPLAPDSLLALGARVSSLALAADMVELA